MAKGKKPITYPSWEIVSGNVGFDRSREERFDSITGGRSSFRWETISGNLKPRVGDKNGAGRNLVAGGPGWGAITGNLGPIGEARMNRYESSTPGYVWHPWDVMSGNMDPLDAAASAKASAQGVLHDLKWGPGEPKQEHHSRGTSWEDLRMKKDRGESAGWDGRSTSWSKSGSGSPKRKRLSLTGALMTEFLDGEGAEDLGLMGKISETARSQRQQGERWKEQQQQQHAIKAAASRAKPPKPSHPRLSAELRAAATQVHSGYLFKEGGGTSFFGSKGWKKRYFAIKGKKMEYFKSKDDFANGEKPLKDLTINLSEYRVVVQYEKAGAGARELGLPPSSPFARAERSAATSGCTCCCRVPWLCSALRCSALLCSAPLCRGGDPYHARVEFPGSAPHCSALFSSAWRWKF